MASHLVAQNPVTTFVTPVAGGTPIDANTVRGNDNTLKTSHNAHDADGTIHVQDSLVASRPVAGTEGRKWLSTDSGALYLFYDTGAVWSEISYVRSTGGTISGALTITSNSANALAVGPNGTTNPSFNVDASTASAATGFNVKSAAAAAGLALSVISSGTDENLTINAKGAGTITIGNASTGNIVLSRATTVSAGGITVTGNSTITGTLGGITTLTATTLAGTLSTAAQANVTSLGSLTGLTVAGNTALGATGSFGSGTLVTFIANASGAPSSNPSGGGILYASSGALVWRGSGGSITTLAPA